MQASLGSIVRPSSEKQEKQKKTKNTGVRKGNQKGDELHRQITTQKLARIWGKGNPQFATDEAN